MDCTAHFCAVVEAGGSNRILSMDASSPILLDDAERRFFQIESVQTQMRRQGVNRLLKDRYSWRGYEAVTLPDDVTAGNFSLSATRDGNAIGTMTVGFENAGVLNCEAAFGEEVRALRGTGRRLCEFTRLAVDPGTETKSVLAALFHVAYIVAHRLRGVDTLLMEVNPRHVRYYERMVGARVCGSERTNTKVNAPAVLLSVDFAFVRSQIEAFAGRPASAERSLYGLAFNLQEEAGIMARLLAMQPQRTPKRRLFAFRLPVLRQRSLVRS